MRILLLIQAPQARGPEIFASHLGQELLENGHQVLLFSLFPGDFDLPFSGKQIHFGRSAKARFWDVEVWKKLSDEIRVFQPDVVQAMGGDTLKWMVFSKILFGWKAKAVFYNGSLVSRYFRSTSTRWANQLFYKKLDGIVAVSEASKLDLEAIARFRGIHRVIPVGVKVAENTLAPEKQVIPPLVHIGGFTFEKNHEGLLRIFKLILEQIPEAKLTLVGAGPKKEEVVKRLQAMGLDQNVQLVGAKPNPFEDLAPNALLVLPSLIEGLPAVILEAFLLEIPVIAYEVGGIGSILKAGETGFPVRANQEKAFAEQVVEVMNMTDTELQPIKNRAQELAKALFGMKKVAEQYENFYSDLCGLSK